MPAVGVVEQRHELGRRRLAESRQRPTHEPLRYDSPDPPAIVSRARMQMHLDLRRDRLGRLDQLAVHVDDVETPVRTVRELARAEPVVLRRKKLPAYIGA